jgi:hypothetical protein
MLLILFSKSGDVASSRSEPDLEPNRYFLERGFLSGSSKNGPVSQRYNYEIGEASDGFIGQKYSSILDTAAKYSLLVVKPPSYLKLNTLITVRRGLPGNKVP